MEIPMRYYPVNLDVRDKDCLVVGGGHVGERKVKTLIDCGARVFVVSLQATEYLRGLASRGVIVLKQREYRSADLNNKFLVIGATDDEEINQQISNDAARLRVLCNIADCPGACSFVLPAIVRQGDLVIAISTSNKSPAIARRIRQELEKEFGPEYALLLNLMGAIRHKLMAEGKSPEANKHIFESLLDEGILDMIREKRIQDVDILLTEELGKGYAWNELMKTTEDKG